MQIYLSLLLFLTVPYSLRLVGKVRLVVDKNRVDGSRVRLAEVEVGDETGTVSLRARDEQIDLLEEIPCNGAVVLRNATIELYQGKYIRLAVTKWGKISKYPDQIQSTPAPPLKINLDRNYSLINFSLIVTEVMKQNNQNYQDSDISSAQASSRGRARHSSRGSGGGITYMQYANTAGQYQVGHLQYAHGGNTQPYYQVFHQDVNQQQQQMMMQYQMQMYSVVPAQHPSPLFVVDPKSTLSSQVLPPEGTSVTGSPGDIMNAEAPTFDPSVPFHEMASSHQT